MSKDKNYMKLITKQGQGRLLYSLQLLLKKNVEINTYYIR